MGVLAAALLAAGLGLLFALGGDFCLDDAWIHLAYALSLKRGDGFSYNPGDFETGSSSPLWALLLALWPWGGQPVFAVKLLGVGLHVASAVLCAQLARTLVQREPASAVPPRPQLAAAIAGGLTALQPSLLQGATSGMEVSLTSALLLAFALCALNQRTRWACALAGLAVLARPETLFFTAGFCALRWLGDRRPRSALPLLAALTALGAWSLYCFAVSGYPWPNTKYVKDIGLRPDGLLYLALQVLPDQPWLLGVTGVALVVLALRRAPASQRAALHALLAGWLALLIATAVSRPYPLGVLFYASRHFAIAAALPHVLCALGALQVRRSAAVALLAPVLVASALLAHGTLAQQRAQEADVRALHVLPAHALARLPPRSIIVVEGAGATRFFTPRSQTIVDMLGLNDRAIAHAKGDGERLCRVLARHPTHLLVPDDFLGITVPLQVTLLRRFDDPAYSMARQVQARSVHLFALAGLKPRWQQLCKP